MEGKLGSSEVLSGSRERTRWGKREVKALRQALNDVPTAVDKNERFKRVSALVGGNHSKKDCYDKYRELKAEAKLKQTSSTSRAASGVSLGSGSSRERHLPAKKQNSPDGPVGVAGSPSIAQPDTVTQQDIFERASTTAGSLAASAGSSLLSRRGSTFSSWSSNSAENFGQLHRRSTTSSTLSSVQSDPLEETIGGSGKMVREAACGEAELMQVEEVDVEDFCLDDELLAEAQHSTARPGQTRDRGPSLLKNARSSTGGSWRERKSHGSSASAPPDGDDDVERRRGTAAVTEAEANGVRDLVLGSASASFNDAWREQGFYFCGIEGLRYGLVQAEGGPCGVLAAVQAFLLEDLIFGDSAGCDWRNPKRSQRERSLTSALTSIIWRAGDGKTAFLAVSEGTASVQRSSRYRPDGFTERLKLHQAGSRSALQGLVRDNLGHFTERKGQGVVLLVYSCIFSRGIEAVRGDMDNTFGQRSTLMASHGYASQELVNLLLVGRAHSNVFDGQRVIGDKGEDDDAKTGGKGSDEEEDDDEAGGGDHDRVVLTGVPDRGRVGFLTLFEAYKHVEVGDRLKTPETPVWVVCSESHYSVLFSPDRSLVASPSSPSAHQTSNVGSGRRKDGSRLATGEGTRSDSCGGTADRATREEGGDGVEAFDLEYYDGLGRQDEVIRLSVDQCHDRGDHAVPTADDEANGALVPPLDLVIRTRWPGGFVDWNGTDPIL